MILWSLFFESEHRDLLIEVQRRLKGQERDGAEYFDGQLLEAIECVQFRE